MALHMAQPTILIINQHAIYRYIEGPNGVAERRAMRRGACRSLRKRRDARTVRSSHLLGCAISRRGFLRVTPASENANLGFNLSDLCCLKIVGDIICLEKVESFFILIDGPLEVALEL